MLQSNIVHHSTTSTSQPSDTSNANPLTVAKVLQKYLLDKNSQEKDVADNEDNNSTDTTNENKQYNKNRNMKQTIKLRESELKRIISESVRRVLNEASTRFSMGRGELSVDASYYRIEKALEGLKRIADTMAETNYYETEESALRCQISYIEQEIDYLRTAMSRDCKSL